MGGIVWIIIIIWIVAAAVNSKKSGNRKSTGNMAGTGSPVNRQPTRAAAKKSSSSNDQWSNYNHSDSREKQQELKNRLAKKYNRSQEDILQRAKASVEEDFTKDMTETAKDTYDAAAVVQSAEERQREINRRIAEKMAMAEQEQSDIMKKVEDLMVTGPDTGIAFERDFVSEGMDMLNRIQN